MSFKYFPSTFSKSSTLLIFRKHRQLKNRLKDDAETTKQKDAIRIFIEVSMFNFRSFNLKSMLLITFPQEVRTINYSILLFQDLFLTLAHVFNSSTLKSFICNFFNQNSLFLLQKSFKEQDFNQTVYINQTLYTDHKQLLIGYERKDLPTINLNKGRGSRTTSIKTLSTLISHVMCQS
jgi:hypothetical protein